MTVVLNFSQMWALFCLVQFYNCTHQNLEPIKPLAKFISFKAIVFATSWQGVGIAILCAIGVLPKEGRFQNALQDFLICVEVREVISHSHATKASIKLENKDAKDKAAAIERIDTHVEAPGTSVTESVQDIVLVGGKRVVKDVVLTINQAIEPVEKGVIKIQEKFHNAAAESDKEEDESPQLEVEEHLEEGVVDGEAKVVSSENKVTLDDTNDR
ncbi:hypothetical protein Scep_028512 [Stephania cephalantha]|uniref:Uncharacterized protein n=1 Tax=Stephania cephalantha TaxID=152367 RepID=A0AAP0HNI2_9MAGN